MYCALSAAKIHETLKTVPESTTYRPHQGVLAGVATAKSYSQVDTTGVQAATNKMRG